MSLNDFERLEKLGKGAYGQVYLVEQLKTRKNMALKVINKRFLYKVHH